MTTQLTMFGARSGTETVRPIEVNDVIVRHDGVRCLVDIVDENINGPVYVCTKIGHESERTGTTCVVLPRTGTTCVVLPREIAYRSNVL